jgi:hypothetical protein
MWRSGGRRAGSLAIRRCAEFTMGCAQAGGLGHPRTGSPRMVLYAPEFGPGVEPEVEVPSIWYTPPEKLIASVSS